MSKTIIGVFSTIDQAEDARDRLIDAGFSASSIDVHSHEFEDSSSSSSRIQDDDDEGFVDSIKQFFARIFGDDDEEHTYHYTEAVRRGHTILSVEVDDDEVDAASALLNRAGAIDLDTQVSQWQAEGYTGYSGSTQQQPNDSVTNQKTRIPVVQEELEVGKRTISKGAVRVYSHLVETPVSESVNLREQHAKIERHPVDRPASAADLEAFKDGSIEIQETEEKAVVSKTARVIEEVEVGAEESENTETIEETVRHNEVEVERNNLRNSPKPGNNTPLRH